MKETVGRFIAWSDKWTPYVSLLLNYSAWLFAWWLVLSPFNGIPENPYYSLAETDPTIAVWMLGFTILSLTHDGRKWAKQQLFGENQTE